MTSSCDEDLIVGQKREIVNRPCFARPLGCGIGVMCKIETRYRTCLNGPPCLPHYRPSVTHLGFGISAAKLPDRAPFAIYARVLAAIYISPWLSNCSMTSSQLASDSR